MAPGLVQRAFVPAESAPLAVLREAIRQVVWTYVERVQPGCDVALEVDAHLVETSKANAQYCYEGYRAFQPVAVVWAETDLV